MIIIKKMKRILFLFSTKPRHLLNAVWGPHILSYLNSRIYPGSYPALGAASSKLCKPLSTTRAVGWLAKWNRGSKSQRWQILLRGLLIAKLSAKAWHIRGLKAYFSLVFVCLIFLVRWMIDSIVGFSLWSLLSILPSPQAVWIHRNRIRRPMG